MTTTLAAWSAKHALLDGLVDDANLFRPASLPMRKALRVHARIRESAYGFAQGRFVIPASRLEELGRERDAAPALTLSVILDVVDEDPIAGAIDRLAAVSAFETAASTTIDSFDVRLPGHVEEVSRLDGLVAAIAVRPPASTVTPALWAEPRYDGGWSVQLEALFPVLAAVRARSSGVAVGAKLRCGAPSPKGVPSVEEITSFIVLAEHAGLPWKATALRRPVRALDPVHGPLHGFLNVFVAGLALHAGVLDEGRVAAVIAEEDPRAFALDPVHVAWRDVSLDGAAVLAGRAHVASFGSSTFFEPVEALREMGFLA